MTNNAGQTPLHILAYTSIALFAFAGNSVLCRLALGQNTIDPSSFTLIRLLSGSATLILILYAVNVKEFRKSSGGSWFSAFMLFLYAITFSFAYISLDTGTGALILFGSVQLSMLVIGALTGNTLRLADYLGIIVAFSGFLVLVLPGSTTPSLIGLLLMTTGGVAWGIYTLRGRGSKSPLSDTTFNFIRTLPLLILLFIPLSFNFNVSLSGFLYAVLSGALASGVGYAIWYRALTKLSVTQAAVVQLLVPLIAALGGVIFANEVISLRLVLSSALVLGGILIVVLGKHYFEQRSPQN